jgi:Tfp pilus assembly protein PilF
VRHSPNDVEVLLYLAEIYRNNNQADLAVPLYQRAIGLHPEQVTASVGLGGIRMEAGQFSEAIRFWQDALSKNAGLELVRVNMAVAQWRSGDLKAAEATLEKAIAVNPGFDVPVELLEKLGNKFGARGKSRGRHGIFTILRSRNRALLRWVKTPASRGPSAPGTSASPILLQVLPSLLE